MKFYVLLISLLFATHSFSQNIASGQKDSVLNVGDAAPNFYLKFLDDEEFYSKDYYGDTRSMPKARKERNNIVFSFFASWCGPCRKEIPELEKLQEKYPDVRIILINVAEDKAKVMEHLKTTPIKLPILLDIYGKTSEKFNVKDKGVALAVLPTLVMIRKDGTLHFYKKGYHEGDEQKIEEQLLSLIQSGS